MVQPRGHGVYVVAFIALAMTSCSSSSGTVANFDELTSGGPDLPRNTQEFVDGAPLIVEATIVGYHAVGETTGWQEDGSIATTTPLPNRDYLGYIEPTLTMEEIELRVDTLYKNSTQEVVNVGDTIIFRALNLHEGGCPSDGSSAGITGNMGESFLYGLDLNPDQDTWTTTFGSSTRFRMNGPVVTDTSCPPVFVAWEPDRQTLTPAQFRSRIQQAIGH